MKEPLNDSAIKYILSIQKDPNDFYFGRLCKNKNHEFENTGKCIRRKSNHEFKKSGRCIICEKIENKLYRESNSEKMKELKKEWYQKNKESIKKYYVKNGKKYQKKLEPLNDSAIKFIRDFGRDTNYYYFGNVCKREHFFENTGKSIRHIKGNCFICTQKIKQLDIYWDEIR